jgi:hypothetical protein
MWSVWKIVAIGLRLQWIIDMKCSCLSTAKVSSACIIIGSEWAQTLNRVAQAVSRRLPNAAARVRARVRSCGICGGQRGIGAGFLRVIRFPLPIHILPIAPQSSLSSGAGTVGQRVATVPSGLSLTPWEKRFRIYLVHSNIIAVACNFLQSLQTHLDISKQFITISFLVLRSFFSLHDARDHCSPRPLFFLIF